jgi:hypothetical protein
MEITKFFIDLCSSLCPYPISVCLITDPPNLLSSDNVSQLYKMAKTNVLFILLSKFSDENGRNHKKNFPNTVLSLGPNNFNFQYIIQESKIKVPRIYTLCLLSFLTSTNVIHNQVNVPMYFVCAF